MTSKRTLLACCLLVTAAGAYLVSNSRINGDFVFEYLDPARRPANVLVDTEAVDGVADTLTATQELMDAWNAVSTAQPVFGTASAGVAYTADNVGVDFGDFTDDKLEVAFDNTGEILEYFGVSAGVLGITLKSVEKSRGRILDFLVVINTQDQALRAPGTGATREQLFRATLLHELGHTMGLGHTPVGMVNSTTFGYSAALPSEVPSMFAFRIPEQPQEGQTLELDDAAALTWIYPEDTASLGSISGTVRGLSGAPVNEILVRAVGPEGAVREHVGSLTDEDSAGTGSFRIRNLPAGRYRVIVEALNGRASYDAQAMAGGSDSLGGNPFYFAADEHWQPGDSYDPQDDDPADFALVKVREGRDTGAIDFVLNAIPIFAGDQIAGELGNGDSQVPNAIGGFLFADYYVFQGSRGQQFTVTFSSFEVTPQLRILGPSRLSVVEEDLPVSAVKAEVSGELPQSGVFTIVCSARDTTGNPGGKGDYTLQLSGAGSGLPPAPTVSAASAALGPADPGDQSYASPVCELPVMQLRLHSPSHEQLWVDRLTLRASGTGDDADDILSVKLVSDADGDGNRGGNESVLASGTFSADNGTLTFDDLDLVIDPDRELDLLVTLDIALPSATQTAAAGYPGLLWLLPVVLLLALRRRRGVVAAVLAFALLPMACGGGGTDCNQPFDPTGDVTTYELRIDSGDIEATMPTQAPGATLNLHTASLRSGTLRVSAKSD